MDFSRQESLHLVCFIIIEEYLSPAQLGFCITEFMCLRVTSFGM
jgi:hypothetical protein